MAEKSNVTLVNFIGGEVGPLVDGRTDLDLVTKSLAWCQNFMVLPQGGITYRAGTFLTGLTKNNQRAVFIPFQFSAADAIMIVASPGKFRFYRNGEVILNTGVTITDISETNPAVVTAAAHGYDDGDEVFITNVNGMTEVNGRFFKVAGATTNTFQLHDAFNANINATGYTAYSSGGEVASIHEVDTPYLVGDLEYLRFAQVGDVMYIVCRNAVDGTSYAPRKLVRNDFTDWTLNTYKRKNDPFAAATRTSFTPTAITQASPAVVTVASTTGLTNGDQVYAQKIGGMTELIGRFFIVANKTGTTFELYEAASDPDPDTAVDSTAYTAFVAGGGATFTLRTRDPAAVAFSSDGRLVFANTEQNPEGFWASRLPTNKATSRFDDFTLGTTASHAMVFNFAPVDDRIDAIQELKQFGGNFALMGASSIRQVFGSTPGTPPSPTTINTLPSVIGAARVRPIVVNWDLLFVDVNGKRLRGLQYNLAYNTYAPLDYNLAADHLGEESPFIKIAYQKGTPDVIWVLREDGVLLSLTFNNIENIAAWARHYPGGDGTVLDIATMRNSSGQDELWLLVERMFDDLECRSVELMSERPQIPSKRQYYSGTQADDLEAWQNAAWEASKDPAFLDMVTSYDGKRDAVLIVQEYVVPDPDEEFNILGYEWNAWDGIVVSEDDNYLFAAVYDAGFTEFRVVKINLTTQQPTEVSSDYGPADDVAAQQLRYARLTPDGTKVIIGRQRSGGLDAQLIVLSATDLSELAVLDLEGNNVNDIAISDDSSRVAGVTDLGVAVYNLSTYASVAALYGGSYVAGNHMTIAFPPGVNDHFLMPNGSSGGSSQKILKYDMTGALAAEYVLYSGVEYAYVERIRISPVSNLLYGYEKDVSSTTDDFVFVYNLTSGTFVSHLPVEESGSSFVTSGGGGFTADRQSDAAFVRFPRTDGALYRVTPTTIEDVAIDITGISVASLAGGVAISASRNTLYVQHRARDGSTEAFINTAARGLG